MKRWLIGLACTGAICTQVQAAEWIGGRSAAGWSVDFVVEDLDPNDGVAAAMNSFERGYLGDSVVGGGIRWSYTQHVAPTFRLTTDSVGGLVNSREFLRDDNIVSDSLLFELAPNTRLTVTGTFHVMASSPVGDVSCTLIGGGVSLCFELITAMFASVDLSLGQDAAYGGRILELQSAHLAVATNGLRDKSFQFVLESGDTSPKTYDFLAVARAGGSGVITTAAVIPEPATMGLLLLGMPLVLARRRRAAMH